MREYLALLCMCLVSASHKPSHENSMKMDGLSTSVWCSREKFCSFHNLCYHPDSKQFLFVLSPHSTFHGLNVDDLKNLELSSVENHNQMLMQVIVVSQMNELLKSPVYHDEKLFVMQPFKHDNMMHMIHDDLLPLFLTYMLLCDDVDICVERYRLTLTGVHETRPFKQWYQMFSKKELLLLSLLDEEVPALCYKEVRVGLTKTTLWYNYGFSGVQGRLQNPAVSGIELRKFRDYIIRSMDLPSLKTSDQRCAVFIERSATRKIINADFVKESIIQSQKELFNQSDACFIKLDLMRDSLEIMLAAVKESYLLVGMHGAAMALALFLPLGASVIELFPFAIDPYTVSPIMAMCDLPHIGLIYGFWRNKNRSSSVPPTTQDPLAGSIAHLPASLQDEILRIEKVKPVKCCHDPAYLYYMFQDTIVGEDFRKTASRVINRAKDFYIDDFLFDSYSDLKERWMIPGPVYNIYCTFNYASSVMTIYWTEPVNSIEIDSLNYQVTVVVGEKVVFNGTVEDAVLRIPVRELHPKTFVWVLSYSESQKLSSKDVYKECYCTSV